MKVFKTVIKIWILALIVIAVMLVHASNPAAAGNIGGWILVGLYFLPTIVAFRHRNQTAIFILNLFLGWTFIGWVLALVWACTNNRIAKISNRINEKTPAEFLEAARQCRS
jgi:hypothetical protein